MPKIYLSPSKRSQNKCICGDNEFLHSRDYIEYLAKFLEAGGADVRINGSNLRFGVKESNIWGADIYYTVRTSPQSSRRGSIIYIGKDGNLSEAYRCATLIRKQRKTIYTGKVTINAVKRFYESAAAEAICICDEILSHSNVKDANFFHKNMKELAKSTAKGMLDYIKYKETHNKKCGQNEACPQRPFVSGASDSAECNCENIDVSGAQRHEKCENHIFECCADKYGQECSLDVRDNVPQFSNIDFESYLIDEEEELISGIGPFPEDNGEYFSILP